MHRWDMVSELMKRKITGKFVCSGQSHSLQHVKFGKTISVLVEAQPDLPLAALHLALLLTVAVFAPLTVRGVFWQVPTPMKADISDWHFLPNDLGGWRCCRAQCRATNQLSLLKSVPQISCPLWELYGRHAQQPSMTLIPKPAVHNCQNQCLVENIHIPPARLILYLYNAVSQSSRSTPPMNLLYCCTIAGREKAIFLFFLFFISLCCVLWLNTGI